MSIERFVTAQNAQLADIEAELRRGHKVTHWMWYVFPQIAGLGTSATSCHYAIHDEAEARAYLAHSTLGPRLRQHTALVIASNRSAHSIFGSPDDLKLKSSMTLYDHVSPKDVFAEALQKHFAGERDEKTLRLLGESTFRSG
jgi:uncharacterized protein (DUF1810 family)